MRPGPGPPAPSPPHACTHVITAQPRTSILASTVPGISAAGLDARLPEWSLIGGWMPTRTIFSITSRRRKFTNRLLAILERLPRRQRHTPGRPPARLSCAARRTPLSPPILNPTPATRPICSALLVLLLLLFAVVLAAAPAPASTDAFRQSISHAQLRYLLCCCIPTHQLACLSPDREVCLRISCVCALPYSRLPKNGIATQHSTHASTPSLFFHPRHSNSRIRPLLSHVTAHPSRPVTELTTPCVGPSQGIHAQREAVW